MARTAQDNAEKNLRRLRLVPFTFITSIVAVLCACGAIAFTVKHTTDVPDQITEYSRATFFATNFTKQWLLAKDSEDADALQVMCPNMEPLHLGGNTAVEVSDMSVPAAFSTKENDKNIWTVTVGATVSSKQLSLRRYFLVRVEITSKGALRAQSLPQPIKYETVRDTTGGTFGSPVMDTSPLHSVMSAFAQGFYGNDAAYPLAQYTVKDFAAHPVTPAFTKVKLLSTRLEAGEFAESAKSGDELKTLLTIQATSPVGTIETFSVLVTVTVSDSGQFVVKTLHDTPEK